jgi:hypothetical protein
MLFFIYAHFSGKQLGCKTRSWFLQKLLTEMGCLAIENSHFYQTQMSMFLPVLSLEENRFSFQNNVFFLEQRQVSFYAGVTFLKNVVQIEIMHIEHQIPI